MFNLRHVCVPHQMSQTVSLSHVAIICYWCVQLKRVVSLKTLIYLRAGEEDVLHTSWNKSRPDVKKNKKDISQEMETFEFWSHMTSCVSIRRLTLLLGVWPWSAAPGCAWTSTGSQWRAVPSGWCWAASAGPHQTATAPQKRDLQANRFRTQRFHRLPGSMYRRLTFQREVDLWREETLPLLSKMRLYARLWQNAVPVPAQEPGVTHLYVNAPPPSQSFGLSPPVASLGGLDGRAARGVPAVCWFVRFPHREPGGVRQTSYLHPSVSLRQQLLGHAVHVQHDAQAARAGDRVAVMWRGSGKK